MRPGLDILFVFPPAHGNAGAFKNHLGVSYFRAVLQRAGILCAQYLNDAPGTVDSVAADILSQNPRLVGFTAYDANLVLCLALARSLKRQEKGVKVLLGGPTATFGAEHILSRHEVIDFCVRGETEETGWHRIEAILNGREADRKALPGLAWRSNGQIVNTPLPPLAGQCPGVENGLDSLPSPYLSGVLTNGRPGVLTGRGCTYHCQYCCFAALGQKRLRLHSLDRVIAELEFIAAHQRRTGEHYVVSIHDDAFTLNPERAKRLCRMLIDRKLDLALSCITRADKVDAELLTLMKSAGFIGLAFGLESSVPSVLRATGKVRPPDWPNPGLEPERRFVRQVRRSVRTAKRLGLNVGVSIILGLPGEKPKDGLATLRFVGRLPVDYYMHNFLWVFPGTPLWESHRQHGVETAINSLGLPTTLQYAYDVSKLRPRAKCSLEHDATMVRLLAADGLFGCEGFAAKPGGLRSVVLRADRLTVEMAEWLSSVMNVGSILIQVYTPGTRREQLLRLHNDRTTFGERLVPSRHHVQLLPRVAPNGEANWTVACSGVDLYCSHKPQLLRLHTSTHAKALLDWAGGRPTTCDLCDAAACLAADDVDDILKPFDGADLFSRLRKMPVPPRLRYPGRWQTGVAPCAGLSRIEIDEQGQVRTCRQGPPIGQCGDSLATLRANLAACLAEAQKRRGCATCGSSQCPRCPFPGIEENAYCSIMRRSDRRSELFALLPTLSRFPLILEAQRDEVGNE